MGHFWVFGYGSLMWRPGFEHVACEPARVIGLHRAPCIYSWVHRGTRERPGIVLGLAKGGSCRGIAFKVEQSKREKVIDYLRARELVTNVYVETERNAILESGESVRVVTYIADPHHEQYAGQLSIDALVQQISGAVGQSGDNESYILETLAQLRKTGIRDGLMEAVGARLMAIKPERLPILPPDHE